MNTTAESTPCFPSRVVRPADARNLQHSDSIRSQDNDPDIATPLNIGSICNTVVAQYEFKYLEFARPTRMVRKPPRISPPEAVRACPAGTMSAEAVALCSLLPVRCCCLAFQYCNTYGKCIYV